MLLALTWPAASPPHWENHKEGVTVYELSLFTGAGGGLLGTHLLGWFPVGYVEWNDYCQRVIAARIRDGILPNAPIFGDIRAFISEGYAASYTGLVDVITGGFPCQPFSTAGKQLGADDERNMWPETIECIRIIRPRYAFLENVSGLLTNRYFGVILGDLASAGYDARWCVLSACTVGAPHTRERLFIVADAVGVRGGGRRQRKDGATITEWRETEKRSKYHIKSRRPLKAQIWNSEEVDILRMADGVGSKMERIRATGNGQVPAVVRAAWELLTA